MKISSVGAGLRSIAFGDVVVCPRTRELRVSGQPVEISHFAFEILLMLIEADGRIVSKKDLFRRLWPSTCVVETNLRVHMYKLRRALGNDARAIKTAPNRGYWLAAPLAPRACTSSTFSLAYDRIVVSMRLDV